MLWLVIEVEGIRGEENISISEVTPEEVEILTPLLLRIQENDGWFFSGDFVETIGGTAEQEYYQYEGWPILCSYLPRPISGIKNIIRVLLWDHDPMSLYMK